MVDLDTGDYLVDDAVLVQRRRWASRVGDWRRVFRDPRVHGEQPMKTRLDMNRIARGLRAERKVPVLVKLVSDRPSSWVLFQARHGMVNRDAPLVGRRERAVAIASFDCNRARMLA